MIKDLKHLQEKLQTEKLEMKSKEEKKSVRSWRVMIGIVIAMSVLALFFVLMGILKHKEAGLLKAVWENDRVVRYSQTEGEDILWTADAFPLSIFVEKGSIDRRNALHTAIRNTNYQVGCQVFSETENRDAARVVANLEAAIPVGEGHGEGGGVTHFQDGRLQKAYLNLYGVPTIDLAALTLEHELGHVLGLAHDDFEMSIMFPTITNATLGEVRMTDRDKKLLRSLYCD